MMQGKKAPSHSPTRNRMAYNCWYVLTDAEQKVKMAHKTSRVEIT